MASYSFQRCIPFAALAVALTPSISLAGPSVTAPHGMVASAEEEASRAGVQILRQGGNAVDAAVAVAFALAVVHPNAGNLGGGGFMLIHLRRGRDVALDFRETAPRTASRNMYLDAQGKVIPKASTVGYRSVATPGTVAGLALAERRFGRLSWRRVIEPARQLALKGFRVSPAVAKSLIDADTRAALLRFPESRRLFFPHGHPYRAGERMVRPDLARTLRRLQVFGPGDFYHGQIAHLIAADMLRNRGSITLADLAAYRPLLRRPIAGSYRGYRIVSMPPPSSGGVALIEMLNILRRYPLGRMGYHAPGTIQIMVEAMRRAFADRSEYLGDPDFTSVPVARLTSLQYANARAKSILPGKATPSTLIRPGIAPQRERPETTHFSIVDRWGNAVACTYTLNGSFGSGITVPGTGIVLNDEMDDFASSPGVPNMFGLIQGERNAIAPGKRPLSSMTPTFVLKGTRLFLVTGSPGGPTIINTVLQVLTNVIDFHMDPARATSASRFHHQWLPDKIRVEPGGLPPDTIRRLQGMGYTIDMKPPMGDAETIEIDPVTGLRTGASDPRGSGVAMGY